MKKSIIICSLVCLPVLFFIGLRHGRQQGRVDVAQFNAAELTGNIYWMGAYHRGTGIRVGASYKIYKVERLLDANGRTFYSVARIGDSVRKAASSDVLYLYKAGTSLPIIFSLKED